MRWLVLVLLLANVIYLGYQVDRQSREQAADSHASLAVPTGVARLTLLSELDALPPLRSDEEPPPEATAGPTPVEAGELDAQLPAIDVAGGAEPGKYTCYSFGPLPEEKHAVWLGDWFRSRRGQVHSRKGEEGGQNLFWVYLAEGTRESATAVMQDLAAKGVTDYRLISHGDLQNSVSLGLFSSQAAVNERLDELKGKGYRPVVVPYTNVRQVYWLDVRVPAVPELLDEMFHGFPARYNSVPVKCDEIAIDQASQ